jgi:salicylate 5-hydroxylase large subunit
MNQLTEPGLIGEPAAGHAPSWPAGNNSRVPYSVYADPALYRRELERFFYSGHWSYVGLEVEVPHAGDFKRTAIGERSVIMVRDTDGAINVVENHCAHRGVQFCQRDHGNTKDFVCPYHQWNYDLKGNLIGLPFRRGVKVKQEGQVRVQGGMPADFDLSRHGLNKLKVERYNGLVFASFDHSAPNLRDYLGPAIGPWYERIFDGRALTLLGYSRQRIPGNWKLMQENIKDPYHPGLLHTWFVTFGLWRADQTSQMVTDEHGRHAVMISRRNDGGKNAVTADDRVLDVVPEPWWQGPSVTMLTLFPSLIIQQQVNSLSTRQILPLGPDSFDFIWTHFGFADDDTPMTRRRLRQANLFGPAGYVSADDGEIIEMSQQGLSQDPYSTTISELDGTKLGGTDHMVTEGLIRGMYAYYRKVMEL